MAIQPAELGCIGYTVDRLGNGFRRLIERAQDQSRADFGQLVVQSQLRLARPDRHRLAQQHRSGVEPLFHLHDGHAARRVAGLDGAVDRSGTTPARQQAGMDVQTTPDGRPQHGGRKYEAVCGNDGYIQFERPESRLRRFVALQSCRRPNRKPQQVRRFMNGATGHSVAAVGWPGRLAIHRSNLVTRIAQGVQRGHGEGRTAHEG